ncbi:hypothetical protein [Hyphomicrobium sp.]|uniref:hypothetical protein n=1 Tax=Hyphomicrobium sp. TaxID=82 RepID=UPI002FDEB76D
MNETKTMIVASVVILVCAYALLWALGLFSGLGFHGTIAAILGVLLASGVGIALMGLLFYSSRSRRDRDVYEQTKKHG